MINNNSYFIY